MERKKNVHFSNGERKQKIAEFVFFLKKNQISKINFGNYKFYVLFIDSIARSLKICLFSNCNSFHDWHIE